MAYSDIITHALSRAQAVSSRAGVAWVIADERNQLLSCDAIIAGYNPRKLEVALSKHALRANQLFLTLEPVPEVFRTDPLIASIEVSRLSEIILTARLPCRLADERWRDWEESWDGEISSTRMSIAAEQANYAIKTIRSEGKPWVTCMTAANLMGASLELSSLSREFGFLSFLSEQVKQSRALLYTRSQRGIVESLSPTNHMDEKIDFFEVDSVAQFDSLLRLCAEHQRYNVIALTDMNTLAYLAEQKLVDEIVHHVTNKGGDSPCVTSAHEHERVSHSLLSLSHWKLTSSSVVDECSRMIFCRKAPRIFSERRLN